ncbi:helix-turn-helix domain-containing protein [Pseudonocardia lacus]|uniref:helix-turn-helix domain-containing protein n=1 Tax=Pseudonocardia lacus TaxID=2835865 RepID=UPI001BDDC425|nr:helix-turn-helix domain-containing protein [Pseudonocardia lacus]
MTGVRAVVTTGIYCVPGCSARPHPDNVRHHPSAAAAEVAGYRACHRCRPYRVDLDATGPPLVTRAVELIAAGLLDDTDEAGLAGRLATSARHLRRCVVEHLGATPDQLARSRRAHLARRLLDDTDLPVADVAFAAGFGSLRQFNRQMRDTFGEAPRALRARRRRADRLVADGGLALRFPDLPNVDLASWLDRRADEAAPGVEHVSGSGYRRVITVHGDPGVLEIRPGPDGALLVVHVPRLHGLTGLMHRARLLVTDRAPWDPVEPAVRAAVGGRDAVGRIVGRLGRPVPGLGPLGLTHAFPTPAALLGATDDDLGPDAEAVRAAARRIGGQSAEGLCTQP